MIIGAANGEKVDIHDYVIDIYAAGIDFLQLSTQLNMLIDVKPITFKKVTKVETV